MLDVLHPSIINRLESHYGTADWRRWNLFRSPKYDWVRYPTAGGTQIQFFANPIGANDPVSGLAKTLEQTNLQKARSLGQQYFIIMAIALHIHVLPKQRQPAGISSDADVITSTYTALMDILKDLVNQGVFHLRFSSALFYTIEQPFVVAPPGFGVEIDQHACSTTKSLWFTQSNDQQERYFLNPQQWIEANQIIDPTLDFPNATSPSFASLVNETTPSVNIGLYLDGYDVLPLQ